MAPFCAERELDVLRQRLKADRARTDRERSALIDSMQEALAAARQRQAERDAAAKHEANFLRRCRVEATVAKASFEKDARRREAFFAEAEEKRAKRAADAERHRAEQQRRSEEAAARSGVAPSAPLVETAQQLVAYSAFDDAFCAFEAAPADGGSFGLATVPWPPASCPVSGVRSEDSAAERKQRLKVALLRWHPDKFEAAHGGKLLEAEREAVMTKVNEVLRQVQAERTAYGGEEGPATPGGGGVTTAAGPSVVSGGAGPPGYGPAMPRSQHGFAQAMSGSAGGSCAYGHGPGQVGGRDYGHVSGSGYGQGNGHAQSPVPGRPRASPRPAAATGSTPAAGGGLARSTRTEKVRRPSKQAEPPTRASRDALQRRQRYYEESRYT